jgi:hypothetical protein
MSASTPPGYELLRTTACDGRYYKVALGEADFDHEYAAHEYAALAHSVLNGWRHGLCDWAELAPMLRALAPNSRPTQADPDRPHARRLAPGAPRLAQRLVLRDAIRGVTLIFLPFEGMTAAGDVFVNKQPLQGLVRVHTGMAAANGAAVAGHATARWGEGTLLPRLEELLVACWTPPPGADLHVTVRACLLRRRRRCSWAWSRRQLVAKDWWTCFKSGPSASAQPRLAGARSPPGSALGGLLAAAPGWLGSSGPRLPCERANVSSKLSFFFFFAA